MSELQYLKDLKEYCEAKIAEIESNQAPVKWEPKGGCYAVNIDGTIIGGKGEGSDDSFRIFGVERETKEQAEHAAEWMRKFNRLLCWFDENAPGHDIDILLASADVSITFSATPKVIDDLRTKIRDGVVEL